MTPEPTRTAPAPLIVHWTRQRLTATRRALSPLMALPGIPAALDDLDRYTARAATLAEDQTVAIELNWSAARVRYVTAALTEAMDDMQAELDAATTAAVADELAASQGQVWAASRDITDALGAQRWTGVLPPGPSS